MKIRNIGRKKEYDVYAIAIFTPDEWAFKDRVVFYIAEDGMVGLGAEGAKDIEVVDNRLGSDFTFHYMDDGRGFMILWNHFSDTAHLAKLLDLDSQTLVAFEAARALRASKNIR